MAPVTFPQELIDLFVGAIASDNSYRSKRIHTLKMCALVSSSFSSPARSHIFSTMTIYYDFSTKAKFNAIQDLWHALESNPQLAGYVNTFEIYVQNIRWNILMAGSGESADQVGLPGIITALARTQMQAARAGRRCKLRTLGLGGYDRHMYATSWSQFHPDFQYAWEGLSRSSAVTTLRVRTIRGYPVGFILEHMPALRRLEMGQSTFDYFPPHLPHLRLGDIPCPRLVELRTDDTLIESEAYESQESKSREVPQRLFGSLEVVECYLLRSWPNVYVDVVKMNIPSIRTLKITSPKYTDTTLPIFPSVDLGSLPCLRTLIIELRHDIPYCWFRLPAVLDLLANSTTNSISSLRIDILTDDLMLQNVGDKPELVVDSETENFQRLDNILSAAPFDALRTLYVRLLSPASTTEIPIDDPSNFPSDIHVIDFCSRLPLTHQKLECLNKHLSASEA